MKKVTNYKTAVKAVHAWKNAVRRGEVTRLTAGKFVETDLPALVTEAMEDCGRARALYKKVPWNVEGQNAWLQNAITKLVEAVSLPAQSKEVKEVKSATAKPFFCGRAAGEAMKAISNDEEFTLVRDKTGRLCIRIVAYELRRKDGAWRTLSWSAAQDANWTRIPENQKRVRYQITPVDRSQAVKWLIEESIPKEFQADLLKLIA
ncbi:MAG: hypothetical protein WC299_06415 [Kiritimatiellia bacterium]